MCSWSPLLEPFPHVRNDRCFQVIERLMRYRFCGIQLLGSQYIVVSRLWAIVDVVLDLRFGPGWPDCECPSIIEINEHHFLLRNRVTLLIHEILVREIADASD